MASQTLMMMMMMHRGRAGDEGEDREEEEGAEEDEDPGEEEERGEDVAAGGAGVQRLLWMKVRARSLMPSHKAKRKRPTIIICEYLPCVDVFQ